MLESMSQLALDYLRERLPDDTGDKSRPWEWYLRVREDRPDLLLPYLVESAKDSMAPNYYVLREDPNDPETAILEQREFRREVDERRLPFVQSTGSQSAAIGPVIKRTYSKGKGGGPSSLIVGRTERAFEEIGESDEPWSPYFAHAARVVSRPRLRFQEQEAEEGNSSAMELAIQKIPETRTSYLAVTDSQGSLPGELEEYLSYLQRILAVEKYSTGKIPPVEGRCALSGIEGTVYPNALSGAGINLTNVDRPGVFPEINDEYAWKKFPLSAAAADLLYIFSYHVSNRFLAQVAGDRALLVPYTTLDPDSRLRFVRQTDSYIQTVSKGEPVVRQENRLHKLSGEEAVTNITILWADFGQKLENVRGMVTDVLPSRLREISEVVNEVNEDHEPPFPELYYEEPLKLDLAFNQLGALLKRPGGKKFEDINSGKRLFDLRRDIAEAVYHGRRVPVERLGEEVLGVAEAYLLDAMERGTYGLTNEGRSKKGETFLTAAGWIRHVSRFLYFLRRLEVYPMTEEWRYRPRNERLHDFFDDPEGKSGIESQEKAYAFLLGALFGKLTNYLKRIDDADAGTTARYRRP